MFLQLKIIVFILFSIIISANGACDWKNPIFSEASPDPWFTFKDGYYYYSRSVNEKIEIQKSAFLSNWTNATRKTIWSPPANTNYSHE